MSHWGASGPGRWKVDGPWLHLCMLLQPSARRPLILAQTPATAVWSSSPYALCKRPLSNQYNGISAKTAAAMDALLTRLGVQAVNFAIRSGLAVTSSFAISQCSRLLNSVDDKRLFSELESLQKLLDAKIRVSRVSCPPASLNKT